MFTRKTCLNWRAALLLAALLALSPAPALARAPFAGAVLYEIGEVIDCNPGGAADPLTDPFCAAANTTEGLGTRIATSTLVGGVPVPELGGQFIPGGVLGGFTGAVTLEGTSVLSGVDFTGPIHAKFTIYTSPTTSVSGTLSGQLDISQALTTGVAPITGQWRATKGTPKVGGTFTGAFLVPFQHPLLGSGYWYVNVGPGSCALTSITVSVPGGSVCSVTIEEFALGIIPLTKAVIGLFQ